MFKLLDKFYWPILSCIIFWIVISSNPSSENAALILEFFHRLLGEGFWAEALFKFLESSHQAFWVGVVYAYSCFRFRVQLMDKCNRFLIHRGLYTDHRLFVALKTFHFLAPSITLSSDDGKNLMLRDIGNLKVDAYYKELHALAAKVVNGKLTAREAVNPNLHLDLLDKVAAKWVGDIRSLLESQSWSTETIDYIIGRVTSVHSNIQAALIESLTNGVHKSLNGVFMCYLASYDNAIEDIRLYGLSINGRLDGMEYKGVTISDSEFMPLDSYSENNRNDTLSTYYKASTKRIDDIESALLRGDVKSLKFHMHFLKNMAGGVGATGFFQFVSKAYNTIRENELPRNVDRWLIVLRHKQKTSCDILKRYYEIKDRS